MRLMISRIGMSRRGASVWVSEIVRSLPHRSQVIRMYHDGKALNGSSRALGRRGEQIVGHSFASADAGLAERSFPLAQLRGNLALHPTEQLQHEAHHRPGRDPRRVARGVRRVGGVKWFSAPANRLSLIVHADAEGGVGHKGRFGDGEREAGCAGRRRTLDGLIGKGSGKPGTQRHPSSRTIRRTGRPLPSMPVRGLPALPCRDSLTESRPSESLS